MSTKYSIAYFIKGNEFIAILNTLNGKANTVLNYADDARKKLCRADYAQNKEEARKLERMAEASCYDVKQCVTTLNNAAVELDATIKQLQEYSYFFNSQGLKRITREMGELEELIRKCRQGINKNVPMTTSGMNSIMQQASDFKRLLDAIYNSLV